MINPKTCKCNPTINIQMEASEKESNDFLIIKNRTQHVPEESKHAETKISKQQKTDKHTHAQQRDKTQTFNYRKPEITNPKPQPHAKMLNNIAGVLKTEAISSSKTQLKTNAKSETEEDTKMKKKEWKLSINEQVRSC